MNFLFRKKMMTSVAMIAVATMIIIVPWDNPRGNDPLEIMAQHQQFSLPSWTIRALSQKFSPIYGTIGLSDEKVLDSYFNLIKQKTTSNQNLGDSSTDIQTLRIAAENIIARKITKYFKKNAVGTYVFGDLFPPLLFKFEEPPYVLIISPRNSIEIQKTKLLKQDLDLSQMEHLEKIGADQNLSVFITRVGGIATFPSFIAPPMTLHEAMTLVIHEWVHHYLFFQPLGKNYWASPEMTTLNESAADLISHEIAALIQPKTSATTPIQTTTRVDYNRMNVPRILRQTRLKTENLLAESRIEEAEAFMEKQRQFLNANGVPIRKLNQAFFAFNGSYAMGPESTSPIGRELLMIRNKSDSIADFLEKIRGVDSIENFNQLVEAK